MSKATVDLKDPSLAAVLAWLIPGLGHFYQGRIFKAVLYFVCILSTFFFGILLGDGKVVHWKWDAERRTYGYLAQVLVGLPALPALVQSYRTPPSAAGSDRSGIPLEHKLAGPFEGSLRAQLMGGREFSLPVTGSVDMEPLPNNEFRGISGKFSGEVFGSEDESTEIPDHSKLELNLTLLDRLEPAIFPSPDRKFECQVQGTVEDPQGQRTEIRGNLYGKVIGVRSLADSFEAPLDEVGLQDANGDLGKYFELGLVYTWIAGLLNILAIWDAFEGPAYGYGNEERSEAPGEVKNESGAANDKPETPPSATDRPSQRVRSLGGRAPPPELPKSTVPAGPLTKPGNQSTSKRSR